MSPPGSHARRHAPCSNGLKGFDRTSKKLTSTTAAGWLWSTATNPTSDRRNIGPEIGEMFTCNFGSGLTFDIGVALLFTGDFYTAGPGAPRPEDLWMAFSRLQMEF